LIWHRIVPVEFNHCDPAGIVFYPRYFEMTNSVVENFFGDALNYSYRRMIMDEHCGTPTVHLDANFRAPSRLGDRLDFSVEVRRVGRTSVNLWLEAHGEDGQLRITAALTLVWVNSDLTPLPWPDVLRDGLTACQEGRLP